MYTNEGGNMMEIIRVSWKKKGEKRYTAFGDFPTWNAALVSMRRITEIDPECGAVKAEIKDGKNR